LNAQKIPPSCYEIRLEGVIGEIWAAWFEGLSIREEFDRELNQPVSILYGPIPDQPALHGLLARIRDLNLTLISIKKIPQEVNDEKQRIIHN
jgi:hypothetical protein